MITIIDKNILDVEAGIICHQTNCIGAFGGLAGAIGRKWPIVYREYQRRIIHIEPNNWKLLGEAQEIQVSPTLSVYNLFGQYDVGIDSRKTEYSALIQAFASLAKEANRDVYIPYKLGCGLGGGNWNIVSDIIEQAFSYAESDVYICKHE